MDTSRFNQAEQMELNNLLEQKQMDDFVNTFTNVVDRCFRQCANDFTSKSVSRRETQCVEACADKFLKHAELVAARFTELSHNLNNPASQP
ncbi:chaperone [Sporodiniella umbellata]|nr:chaperone [Sporodiniella umbellata]